MASTYDILLEQGSTFSLTLSIKQADKTPKVLTGYSCRMQVRRSARSDDVMIDFSSDFLSSDLKKGIILIDGENGLLTLQMKSEHTVSSALPSFSGVYDLELIHNEGDEVIVERVLSGKFTVDVEITRQ